MKKTMKQFFHSQAGFTLIEMMIVLVIISILLLIVVPNLSKNQEVASQKGCDATISLLTAQVVAYQIENNEPPTSLEVLVTEKYVENITCPDGSSLYLTDEMVVEKEE